MRRASIITAAAAVFAIAGLSRANLLPVNSNTVVQDGIEYYIETDKVVYDLGEDVQILYRITNLRDEQWRVGGPRSRGDVIVESKEGLREVWSWRSTRGGPGDAGPRILQLEANEAREIPAIWGQLDYNGTFEFEDDFLIAPGQYRVLGIVAGTENFSNPIYRSVGLDIFIVPEPGSFALFMAGALCLKHHRRRNTG